MSKKQLDDELYACVQALSKCTIACLVAIPMGSVGRPQLTRVERNLIAMMRFAARAYHRAQDRK